MTVSLNTGDALYSALSHLFLVDDDNLIKELKAGLTVTPHASVLLPNTGSSTSPVGRSFRPGGASYSVIHGVDFPEYACSNAGALSVFIAFNQFNSAVTGSGAYAACAAATDTAGIKVGDGWMMDVATGRWTPHNNNSTVALSSLTLTTGSITGAGIKSIAFTRNGNGPVKAYINGVVDSAFAGGLSNAGAAFGANWGTSTLGLIGGMSGSGYVSFDYTHWCDFVGTELTEADVLRLHNSLTGSNAFALVSLPADTTAPTLTSPTGTSSGTTTASGTVSTNEANGTLYRLASTNASENAATVKAAALTQSVTATGTQAVAFTGLTSATTYHAHYVHRDAAGNDSAVASSASFTTASGGDTTAPVLAGAITVAGGSVTTTGWQADWPAATDNVAVTGYDISTDGGVTWPINWPVNNYTYVGYAAGTTYALRVRARDAAGNLSAVIAGSVTTLLPTITTDALEDETGAVLASTLIAKVAAVRLSDMSVAATWANQTTSAGGVLTLQHAALTAVAHIVVTSSATGAAAGAKAYTPVL